MLAHDEDLPPFPPQATANALVSRDVALNLRSPPSAEVSLEVVTASAPMPEAAVNEDHTASAKENQIGATREASSCLSAIAVCCQESESSVPKSSGNAALGCSPTAISSHGLTALLWCHDVDGYFFFGANTPLVPLGIATVGLAESATLLALRASVEYSGATVL